MPDDSMLASGWEWRGYRKVKKNRKHYIRADGTNIVYVGVGRGDYTFNCEGGIPSLKLAILTYYDDDIRARIEKHDREIRRNMR